MKKIISLTLIFLITFNVFVYLNSIRLEDDRRFISINPIFNLLKKIELNIADCQKINNYVNLKIKYSYSNHEIEDLIYLRNCNKKEFNFVENYKTIKLEEKEYVFFAFKYMYYLDIDLLKKNIIKNGYSSKEAQDFLNV